MVSEYGIDEDGDINTDIAFVKGMKKYCGMVMTVSSVELDEILHLECSGWNFSNDMIEGAIQK